MQNTTPRPTRAPNLGRAKEVTKNVIKRFGPFVLTGLAAVAEHHWLKHDDNGGNGNSKSEDKQSDPRARERDRDDDSDIRRLKREVRDLRRSMKRNERKAVEMVIDSDSDGDGDEERESSLEVMVGSKRANAKGKGKRQRGGIREAGVSFGRGEQPREDYFSFKAFEDQREREESEYRYPPPPPAPTPPLPPPGAPIFAPIYEPPPMEDQNQNRGADFYSRPKRHRRHRHTSLPPPLPKDEEALHATKVATIAGIIEGLHVADIQGNWLGPKGMRVGTAMAAAAGTSYIRGKRESDQPRDMVVDVGTGLLVTRLVHGSSKHIEERGAGMGRGREKKRRRWSHAY